MGHSDKEGRVSFCFCERCLLAVRSSGLFLVFLQIGTLSNIFIYFPFWVCSPDFNERQECLQTSEGAKCVTVPIAQ